MPLVQLSSGATTGGGNATLTFPAPVTAGNSIIVIASSYISLLASVTGSVNGALTRRVGSDPASNRAEVWCKHEITGGSETLTLVGGQPDGNRYITARAIEWSGISYNQPTGSSIGLTDDGSRWYVEADSFPVAEDILVVGAFVWNNGASPAVWNVAPDLTKIWEETNTDFEATALVYKDTGGSFFTKSRIELLNTSVPGAGDINGALATFFFEGPPPPPEISRNGDESSTPTDAQTRSVADSAARVESATPAHTQTKVVRQNNRNMGVQASATGHEQNRTVADAATTAEASTPDTAQNATVEAPTEDLVRNGAESSEALDTQNFSIGEIGRAVSESSVSATTQTASSGIQRSASESSASADTQTQTTGSTPVDIVRAASESATAATTQKAVVTPPQPAGNGASGVRRWLTQYYTDYFEKRKKDKEAEELAKSIEHDIVQGSAGQIPKITETVKPVVSLTPDAAVLERRRLQLAHERQLKADLETLQATNELLAHSNFLRMDNIADLQRRHEQDEEDDYLLLSAVL